MSNIILKSKEAAHRFLKGEIVFRITSSKTHENGEIYVADKGIVTTFSDFEKLLAKHEYISLIHLAPLIYKISYVYGCLNIEKGMPREETFTIWYRELSKHEWKEWFIIQPYKD